MNEITPTDIELGILLAPTMGLLVMIAVETIRDLMKQCNTNVPETDCGDIEETQ